MSDQHLIALQGGPKDHHWYWLADWQRHVGAVRAQNFPADHPAMTALDYQPTGRHVDNPNPKYGAGEVWAYSPEQSGEARE